MKSEHGMCRLCIKLTFSKLGGSRKKGRPKLRWLDDILQDLNTSTVTAWWRKGEEEYISMSNEYYADMSEII
jgi:hypothetical protein